MSLRENKSDRVLDPAMEEALGNFRRSVHAWSEAASNRTRIATPIAGHRRWRLAAGWALGCVLAAGSLTGGIYERHHRQAVAEMKAAHEAALRESAARQRARQADEDLLATVDTAISREVPVAMEPLAQLMDSDEDQ
jgi:hypothetical protein